MCICIIDTVMTKFIHASIYAIKTTIKPFPQKEKNMSLMIYEQLDFEEQLNPKHKIIQKCPLTVLYTQNPYTIFTNTIEYCCMPLSKCENLFNHINSWSQAQWVEFWGSVQSLALAFRTFAHSSSSAAASSCLVFSAPLKHFLYPSRNYIFAFFLNNTNNKLNRMHFQKSGDGFYKLFTELRHWRGLELANMRIQKLIMNS